MAMAISALPEEPGIDRREFVLIFVDLNVHIHQSAIVQVVVLVY